MTIFTLPLQTNPLVQQSLVVALEMVGFTVVMLAMLGTMEEVIVEMMAGTMEETLEEVEILVALEMVAEEVEEIVVVVVEEVIVVAEEVVTKYNFSV